MNEVEVARKLLRLKDGCYVYYYDVDKILEGKGISSKCSSLIRAILQEVVNVRREDCQ